MVILYNAGERKANIKPSPYIPALKGEVLRRHLIKNLNLTDAAAMLTLSYCQAKCCGSSFTGWVMRESPADLIVITWSVICFEDLSLKALARTKHSKSWLDAAFGELLRQVEYKALWNCKHFVQVDRFFPSTKLCSECGYKNDDLSLSGREWTCPGCRSHHHRDSNAAKNLRAEGLKIVAEGHRRR